MAFCTKGLPGVAESTVQKAKENPLPEGEGARRVEEGDMGNQPENPSLLLNLNIQFIGKS